MTQRRARLDHSRSFGVVYGGGVCRYEQDGKQFDHRGMEINSPAKTGEATAWQPPGDTVARAEAPISPATERMRRTRQRRREGIAAVVSVEVHKRLVEELVARHLLSPSRSGDRAEISAAVLRALNEWRKT